MSDDALVRLLVMDFKCKKSRYRLDAHGIVLSSAVLEGFSPPIEDLVYDELGIAPEQRPLEYWDALVRKTPETEAAKTAADFFALLRCCDVEEDEEEQELGPDGLPTGHGVFENGAWREPTAAERAAWALQERWQRVRHVMAVVAGELNGGRGGANALASIAHARLTAEPGDSTLAQLVEASDELTRLSRLWNSRRHPDLEELVSRGEEAVTKARRAVESLAKRGNVTDRSGLADLTDAPVSDYARVLWRSLRNAAAKSEVVPASAVHRPIRDELVRAGLLRCERGPAGLNLYTLLPRS